MPTTLEIAQQQILAQPSLVDRTTNLKIIPQQRSQCQRCCQGSGSESRGDRRSHWAEQPSPQEDAVASIAVAPSATAAFSRSGPCEFSNVGIDAASPVSAGSS
eukprot:TRINITY_DN7274_c0_g1_i1.p1 TRINITY_DN7274_c0_g1~~TRINITY_DN7274_c0_g1_i1.p1  ORF type:complete len:103 (+),score=6.49 TRINITY_DN7274_c0_g1_i1:108-416(+)